MSYPPTIVRSDRAPAAAGDWTGSASGCGTGFGGIVSDRHGQDLGGDVFDAGCDGDVAGVLEQTGQGADAALGAAEQFPGVAGEDIGRGVGQQKLRLQCGEQVDPGPESGVG